MAGARFVEIIAIKTTVIKKHDQVDIRAVVQLARAHFPHRKRNHTARDGNVVVAHTRQLVAANFLPNLEFHRSVSGVSRKVGERTGNLFQVPDASKIGQSGQKRDALLGDAQ